MQYISNIKEIAKKKKIKLKDLAIKVGMSEQGFHKALRMDSLKVSIILKICETLEVEISELFKEDSELLKDTKPSFGLTDRELLEKILENILDVKRKLDKE